MTTRGWGATCSGGADRTGDTFYSFARDGTMRAWDHRRGLSLWRTRVSGRAPRLAAGGRWILVGAGRAIHRYRAGGRRLEPIEPPCDLPGEVEHLARAGDRFLAVTSGGQVLVLDSTGARIRQTIDAPRGGRALAVQCSADKPEAYLIRHGERTILRTDARARSLVTVWAPSHRTWRTVSMALTGGAERLYVLSEDGRVERIRLGPGRAVATAVALERAPRNATFLAVSRDERHLAIGYRRGVELRRPDGVMKLRGRKPMRGYVSFMSFEPGARRLYWTTSQSARVGLCVVETGDVLQLDTGHRAGIVAAALLPGDRLLTADADGEVRLLDAGLLFRDPGEADLHAIEAETGFFISSFRFLPLDPSRAAAAGGFRSRWSAEDPPKKDES